VRSGDRGGIIGESISEVAMTCRARFDLFLAIGAWSTLSASVLVCSARGELSVSLWNDAFVEEVSRDEAGLGLFGF